jgi:hypothetical protein
VGGSSLVPIRDQDTLRAVQIEAGLTQALNSKFFSPDKVAEYFRLRFEVKLWYDQDSRIAENELRLA